MKMQYRDKILEQELTVNQEFFVDIDFLAGIESDYDEALDLESSGCTDATTFFSKSEENDNGLYFGEVADDDETSTHVIESYSSDSSIPIEGSISRPRGISQTLVQSIDTTRREPPRRNSASITMPMSCSTFLSTENDTNHKASFDLALLQSCEQKTVPMVPQSFLLYSLDWSISSSNLFSALMDNVGEGEHWNDLMYLNNDTEASSTIAPSEDSCTMSKSSTASCRKRCRRKEPVQKEYVTLSDRDVLLGRGGYSHHHPGNIWYRKLVLQHQKIYKKLDNNEKTAMSMKVVAQVQESGGRFLKRDETAWGQKYYIVPHATARLKVSQALREDHTPDGRRQKKERTSAYQLYRLACR